MSSADDEPHNSTNLANQSTKKRRVQRACDACRRKKSEGDQTPGSKCITCIEYDVECTYLEEARKRCPPKGYVESLESRLEKMEALLHRLCPDVELSQELLDAQLDGEGTLPQDRANSRGPLHSSILPGASAAMAYTPPRLGSPAPASGSGAQSSTADESDELDPSDDEDTPDLLLQERIRSLQIDPMHKRFVGKLSGYGFVRTAMDLKSQYANKKVDAHNMVRRPQFWRLNSWERNIVHVERRHFTFPEPDLLQSLVDLYFKHINLLIPLLHRPTFDAAVAGGLHRRDESFAGVLLLVCACASRYSDDERVILEGTNSWHSAGWAWFSQVQVIRKPLLSAPCLYDLQAYSGCAGQIICWTVAGIGIRLAQDVGAHRRKVYNRARTVEDELWKRAFWVLVVLDRMMSAGFGRPCAIQEEDFDIDLPAECDDEYWTHPDTEQAFKQPAGKASYMSYFICFLELSRILAFALRTIYSINKSKMLLGLVGEEWEQHTVAELDSALNKWIDSVPHHLRWDPTREDETFFLQSASLYCAYYNLQIFIHRPFIPSPRKQSRLAFPSLAICTNAARACSHVADLQRRRTPSVPLALFQLPVFTSAIVLLLNIWGARRSGVSIDPAREMDDVHKCMRVLKDAEDRHVSFIPPHPTLSHLYRSMLTPWDVLYEIASVGDLPLPDPSPAPSNKRPREHEHDDPDGLCSPAASPALPLHTEELGRMPLYAAPAHPSPGGGVGAGVSVLAAGGSSNSNSNSNSIHDSGSGGEWYTPTVSDTPGSGSGAGSTLGSGAGMEMGMGIGMGMDAFAGAFPVDQLVSEAMFPHGFDFSQFMMDMGGAGLGDEYAGAVGGEYAGGEFLGGDFAGGDFAGAVRGGFAGRMAGDFAGGQARAIRHGGRVHEHEGPGMGTGTGTGPGLAQATTWPAGHGHRYQCAVVAGGWWDRIQSNSWWQINGCFDLLDGTLTSRKEEAWDQAHCTAAIQSRAWGGEDEKNASRRGSGRKKIRQSAADRCRMRAGHMYSIRVQTSAGLPVLAGECSGLQAPALAFDRYPLRLGGRTTAEGGHLAPVAVTAIVRSDEAQSQISAWRYCKRAVGAGAGGRAPSVIRRKGAGGRADLRLGIGTDTEVLGE
ncbi:hypothetical protein DENSPDRAFT_853569 [Dentipellis sp. KUC8613]|nr:hypothetical protein DENSPDRAFT_853569 [Dentipellis sp. KUC8613]